MMKKILLVCCLVFSVVAVFAIAGQVNSPKPDVAAGVELVAVNPTSDSNYEAAEPIITDADLITRMDVKARYYELVDRLYAGLATEREITEIHELCFSYDLPLPESLMPREDPSRNPLDQGSPDTLANCASATVITGCGYTDSGTLDGDNDCSVISASPYNEVFYTFTPGVSGSYTFRLTTASTLSSPVAIRVVRGGCCSGAIAVAFSSATTTDPFCNVPIKTTYVSPLLTAGTQYWIHCGTNTSTAGDMSTYTLSVICTPCPTDEPAAVHNTCATAVPGPACGDSLSGDSAISANSDWYSIQVTTRDSVRIWLGGREPGHCNSQLDGVDGRFDLVAGDCTTLIDTDDDGTSGVGTCGFDAAGIYCLNAGTYYIRVWNYGVQPYVLKVDCFDCPPPIDCATFYPCDVPAEVEPNTTCTDSLNFISLNCTDGEVQNFYGTICPDVDVDYFFIPTIPANRQIFIRLFQGPACDQQPPVGTGLAMRGATGAGGVCAGATGTSTNAYLIGSLCAGTPTAGGYIGVVRLAGPAQKYRVEVQCIALACPSVVVPNQWCSSCAGPIPDVSTVSYPINVPIEYHITDVNVRVDITHTYDADIDMWVVTPWGDTLELSTDNGSSGDNYQVTVFDDEGTNGPVTAGVAPFNGSYIPEELLAGADGFNAIGTWTLLITDDVGGDVGFVNCWCLEFEFDYILAVELTSFAAIAGDREVNLAWTTASESNNSRFDILRDGHTVGQVEATNNPTGSNYTWTDLELTNGTTYTYSLVAVDVNGNRVELATQSATPTASEAVITEYALHQNYPNPFNPTTSITFDLVEGGMVTLKVYNVVGQEVAQVVNGSMVSGRHTVSFEATGLPSGLYIYRLETSGFVSQHKMLLMK